LHKLYSIARTREDTQLERYGQALFNTLREVRPDIADRLLGTQDDPFYANDGDEGLERAVAVIESMWLDRPPSRSESGLRESVIALADEIDRTEVGLSDGEVVERLRAMAAGGGTVSPASTCAADDAGWQGYISREGGPDRAEATARRTARRDNAIRVRKGTSRPKPRKLSAEDLAAADAESAARHALAVGCEPSTVGDAELRERVEGVLAEIEAAGDKARCKANSQADAGGRSYTELRARDLALGDAAFKLRAALE
jgi:hypothetical protein